MKVPMRHLSRKILIGLGVVIVLILIVYALLPTPRIVETARVTRGPLRSQIDAEGELRFHDHFVVAAPVTGALSRIDFREGDTVHPGTLIATIEPPALDARQRQEARERVNAAATLVREAETRVGQVRTNLEQARRQRERTETLFARGTVTREAMEAAVDAEHILKAELEAATLRAKTAGYELAIARTALSAVGAGAKHEVTITSPVEGTVLRIFEKSARTVMVGTPLVELGDPMQREIVIDVLSSDAVRIHQGDRVLLAGWGGDRILEARVQLIEPAAFTKISALGIEEKRVNVIAALRDYDPALGDGYRVQASIILWEGQNTLQVPSSALFRHGDGWSTFVVDQGKARRTPVTVGHRNAFDAEILGGIDEGKTVIVHPSNELRDGEDVKPAS